MNHDDLNNVALKEQEANMKYDHTINVCVAASCLSSHADQVMTALDEEVKRILEKNAATIRGANVDYAEMFRKAKRMLAEKKKIPL